MAFASGFFGEAAGCAGATGKRPGARRRGGAAVRAVASPSSSSVVTSTRVTPTSSRVNLGPLRVSPLGVGAWSWGDNIYWGKGDEREENAAFGASLAGGVNFFDTAEMYGLGESERRCGRFLREYTQRGEDGNDVVLASKFGPLFPIRTGANSVVDACRRTLDRLGVERIGLYQLHWPGLMFDRGYWDGIARCYEQGLISGVGVSNYGPKRLRSAHHSLSVERGVPILTNQVLYNLVYRRPEDELKEVCDELGVTILAYSPMAQGALTGKYEVGDKARGVRASMLRSTLEKTVELRTVLREVAESKGRKVSQVALNWLMCKGVIPLAGARNARQAEENAGAVGWSLDDAELATLDSASEPVREAMPGMPVYNEIFVPR